MDYSDPVTYEDRHAASAYYVLAHVTAALDRNSAEPRRVR
jgi:hypothetical protein